MIKINMNAKFETKLKRRDNENIYLVLKHLMVNLLF